MKPVTIALVLLTHNPDEPAGVERAVASLAEGLRELGHRAVIVAAGPATASDGPDLVRLTTLSLPRPMLFDDLPRLLADPEPVRREVLGLLTGIGADVACWTDAVVGLGYLNPAPPGTRTALMLHFLRVDEPIAQSLAHRPDTVITPSPFLTGEAARAGLDTNGWHALPNALLCRTAPPAADERERLRRTGPVRILGRADPSKGIAELLRACPPDLGRPVEIVLAAAGFELWPGMQDEVLRECRALAARLANVEILPAVPWSEVQPFLAGAALALVPSTSPETFGNVAAEALSVGTPVVGYGFGHLPVLTGTAGRMVPLDVAGGFGHLPPLTGSTRKVIDFEEGAARLWRATTDLLADADAYHAAARQAPLQVAAHTPAEVAREFLRITLGPEERPAADA
ncbi:glycosyltransferase family 4 protein [Actinacidiphila sp. ITFR-21]|uniref:glycosyltransferase family 4 protein n=1 Tax=Actinacidiphila sp. ITFR-21 TaxID=3075199 RepID=UPI00288B336B|nr:glycosyltransferase family 4 protein [Streptomyces sp. ITFR-21]WNI18830.1 glycosyltransferase family 4 protein [Streptomyces sp. ITFR-21]